MPERHARSRSSRAAGPRTLARIVLAALVGATSFVVTLSGSTAAQAVSGTLAAELDPPFTFYFAEDFGDDGDPALFEYEWTEAFLECTGPDGFQTNPDDPREAVWDHDCGPHENPSHPGFINLFVRDPFTGTEWECTYKGSLSDEIECPVVFEPSPAPSETVPTASPSESVPTASPSPSPTGPVLVLTKTVDPKVIPIPYVEDSAFVEPSATWTIKVSNVGNATYEGRLLIIDRLPDIWNLYPEEARADGAMGFSNLGVFYEASQSLTVLPGMAEGDPAWVGMNAGDHPSIEEGSYCELSFEAGSTGPEGTTTADEWDGATFKDIQLSSKAKKLRGSAKIECDAIGRIEPGAEVVITIIARRPLKGGTSPDVKMNLAEARWDDGEAKAKASVKLDGIKSIVDDFDFVFSPARATTRPMGAGPGEGLFGTEAADELTGTSRSDLLLGHYGDDVLRGLAGIDVISGDVGNDAIYGGGARDGLIGGSGKDLIYGGKGNDEMVGGPDQDRLFGGAGDDWINARDGERDIVKCGSGRDTAIVDKKDKVKGCEKIRRK